MKILRIFLLLFFGFISTVLIQFSFKFQREIYPLVLVGILFFTVGFFIKKIVTLRVNIFVLYIVFALPFLYIQSYGLRINFEGLKYLSPTLVILSLLAFFLGNAFLALNNKLRPLLITVLVVITCFLGFYAIPKLYYEAKKQNQNKKIVFDGKLKDYQGNYYDISLIKNKVVFVNFWDSKCAFCFDKLPYIEELKKKVNSEEIVFLEINPANLDSFDDFRKAIDNNDMLKQFNPLFDEGAGLSKKLGVETLPHQFIIDKSGVLKTDYLGFSKSAKPFYVNDNAQYLNDLLNEK